jgi:MFS family permease
VQRKQLLALSACNLGVYVVGFMVISLLPVYATQRGMDEGAIGIYLALAYAGLTAGTLVSGWLSNRFQRRRLTILLASVAGIPAAFLIGQAENVVLMILFTMIVWFVGGIVLGMATILAGLHVTASERGRVFGILVSASALGGGIGSFAAGAVVERGGFTLLFSLTALVWLIPAVATLFIDDTRKADVPTGQPKAGAAVVPRAVLYLLLSSVLVSIVSVSVLLTRPLKMNSLGFDSNSISSATGISQLMGILVPFLIGALSDRVARKQLLIACYLLSSVGILVLASAVDLWHFWGSSILFALASGATGVANAFVIDLSPPEALSTALARFSATPWIGAVIGFGLSGFFIQSIGLTSTLIVGAGLPLAGIVLLWAIRPQVRLAPA